MGHRTRWLFLIPLAGLVAGPSHGLAQVIIEIPRNRSGFTAQEAAWTVERTMPLVERKSGRKFRSRPRIRLIFRQQDIDHIRSRLRSQGLDPDVAGHDIIEAKTYSVVGVYRVDEKTLYLLPDNFNLALSGLELPPGERLNYLQYIVAHELVHVLQDEQLGTRALADCKTPYQIRAMIALQDGQADYVARLVLEHEGHDASKYELREQEVPAEDQRGEGARRLAREINQAYRGGLAYIEAVVRTGGMERVWQRLGEAPPDWKEIVELAERTSNRPLAEMADGLLDGVERALCSLARVRFPSRYLDRTALWTNLLAWSNEDRWWLQNHIVTCETIRAQEGRGLAWWQLDLYTFEDPAAAVASVALFQAHEKSSDVDTLGTLDRPVGGRPGQWCNAGFHIEGPYECMRIVEARGKYVLSYTGVQAQASKQKVDWVFDTIFRGLGQKQEYVLDSVKHGRAWKAVMGFGKLPEPR